MPTKIRLQRRGRKKRPFYHIVVADSRAPRDGRFIEKLGTYNPMTSPASIELDVAQTMSWLMKGAQPTDTARAILKFKGVMYKKHLHRGVSKGAFSQEEADKMWDAFMNDKNAKIQARIQASKEEHLKNLEALSGVKIIPTIVEEEPEKTEEATEVIEAAAETVVETTEEVVAETAAETAEETASETDTSAEEPAAEADKE
jgi:small subunit ribosomal protein S16